MRATTVVLLGGLLLITFLIGGRADAGEDNRWEVLCNNEPPDTKLMLCRYIRNAAATTSAPVPLPELADTKRTAGPEDRAACTPRGGGDSTQAALDLLNSSQTTYATLTGELGISPRSARSLLRARERGPLTSLNGIPWVGPKTKAALYKHAPAAPATRLRIGTFNIRHFGLKKLGLAPSNPKRAANVLKESGQGLELILAAVCKHDLVAIQEVKDKSQAAIATFRDLLHERCPARRFEYIVSRMSGDEQYAYFYDSEKFAAAPVTLKTPQGPKEFPEGVVYDGPLVASFARPPFIARFKAKDGDLDLLMGNIHTEPGNAVGEIVALQGVNDWLNENVEGAATGATLIVGDLNADCAYSSRERLERAGLRFKDIAWYTPTKLQEDRLDSAVSDQVCFYDRIALSPAAKERFTGDWYVTEIDRPVREKLAPGEPFDFGKFAGAVSDHKPLSLDLYANPPCPAASRP